MPHHISFWYRRTLSGNFLNDVSCRQSSSLYLWCVSQDRYWGLLRLDISGYTSQTETSCRRRYRTGECLKKITIIISFGWGSKYDINNIQEFPPGKRLLTSLSNVSRIMKTGGTSSSKCFIMVSGMLSLRLYLQKGTTYKFASDCFFFFWLSSTIVTCPSLSKKTTLNLSLPFEVQVTITPRAWIKEVYYRLFYEIKWLSNKINQ